jgi:transposase
VDIKRLLNECHHFPSFVYGKSWLTLADSIHVAVRPRKGSKALCSICGAPGPIYDTSRKARLFEFVPLWGFKVFLQYFMRRVTCAPCGGVKVERVPWADGKNQACNVYRLFLARWARLLSWTDVARTFRVDWGTVYRAVDWVVAYGLAHRSLDCVTAIGVDELAVWAGQAYITVVYQIDQGMRRLLWVGPDRTKKCLRAFFDEFGQARSAALRFVASDMWKNYLTVIAERAKQAVNVLDRFHIVAKVNKAVDEVRASEARELARKGFQPILKHTKWALLKRRENRNPTQRARLRDVLRYPLRTVRAFLLKEALDGFWKYTSPAWAGWFLDKWCTRALRSRLQPMCKIARTLRGHRDLILNWFRARKEISSGTVEGMNGLAKLAIRKARGFRTYFALRIALYHSLGHLPEPESTHRFC